ncbi:MAG: hypothetical protein CSA84_03615 [Actinomycetales bacterium]|nr:MAG: hypothetical protein CSA84_03615 [Actinomycetales bacterium]
MTVTDHPTTESIRPSTGSVADAYDNALTECVTGLSTTERIKTIVFHASPSRTISDLDYATAGCIDRYNTRHLHSTLEMITPVEFEQAHYPTLNREPHPVQERRRTWGASVSSAGVVPVLAWADRAG